MKHMQRAILAMALVATPALALESTMRGLPPPSDEMVVPIPSLSDNAAGAQKDEGTVEILSDPALLPEPVRRMREQILEACRSGNLEGLRALLGTGDTATQLSFGEAADDPIEFLRAASGDGEGHEILAILAEVMEENFVRLDAGTSQELYVWPYFFAYPLDQLDAPQRVRLFRLVTSGDYEGMLAFGGYNFYRAGITPEGHWAFFVAGD